MTDQEINQRIHTLAFPDCWVVKKRGYYYRPNAAGYTGHASEAWRIPHEEAKKHEYPYDEPVTIHPAPPLDYVNSLDAMHEAEKTLDPLGKDGAYEYWLRTVCHIPERESAKGRYFYRATARKRAEAFLLVHEKEEVK